MTEEPVAKEFYEKWVKLGQNMATLERIELHIKTPIKSKKALLVYHGMYERNAYVGTAFPDSFGLTEDVGLWA